MGNFRYCKKYNGIEEHFDVAQEVKERIIGYIWKELNNNNYNKILLGPLSINNNGEKLEMSIDVDIIREKIETVFNTHVLVESPSINISLDNLSETDNELKIKSKTKKIETIDDDGLFEDVEEIKFEEKDERIKIKSYPKEVSDIDYQNETTNGVPSNDDEEEDEVDYIKITDKKLLNGLIYLIERGEKIKAIKLYRYYTGLSLKEGKRFIDDLIKEIDEKKNKQFKMLSGLDNIKNLGISVKQMQAAMSIFGSSSMINHQYLNSFINNNNDTLEELSKEEQDEQNKENTRKFLKKKYKTY